MSTVPTTEKWSDLRGMAVVSVTEGKKIGTCEDFFFEPTTLNIRTLEVKAGLLSHKMLPVPSINTIGQDAITMASENSLQDSIEGESGAALSGDSVRSYKVMSASGKKVGEVGNILIDISTPSALHVTGYELSGGLRERIGRKYTAFAATEVISYGQDVMVISDQEAQQLE